MTTVKRNSWRPRDLGVRWSPLVADVRDSNPTKSGRYFFFTWNSSNNDFPRCPGRGAEPLRPLSRTLEHLGNLTKIKKKTKQDGPYLAKIPGSLPWKLTHAHGMSDCLIIRCKVLVVTGERGRHGSVLNVMKPFNEKRTRNKQY